MFLGNYIVQIRESSMKKEIGLIRTVEERGAGGKPHYGVIRNFTEQRDPIMGVLRTEALRKQRERIQKDLGI